MAHLSIVGSRLIAGTGFDQNAEVRALLEDPSRHCVLLYPGENALNLSALESDRARRELLAGPKLTIFVLDATWPLAATMLKKTPRLLELPRVSFDSTRPSEYRFKRQPAPHCLSTLEAVSELVRLLEPKADADSLLGAFRKMVERQIQYSPGAKAPMPPIMPNDSCDRARAP